MCNINITSQKFRFPIFPFCFLLFIFSFFFLFFLFFPFSFPVFLLSFFLHAQAIHGRIRGRRSLHARVPVITEFQVWAPPLMHVLREFSLSRARNLHQPIRDRVCRTIEEQKQQLNSAWGPPLRLDLSVSPRFARASKSPPNRSRSFLSRDLNPEATRSRISLSTNSNASQLEANPSRETRAEPKQKGPITRRHVAPAADLKK